MTQLEYAKNNILSPLIKKVSGLEEIPPGLVLNRIKTGKVVIPANKNHRLKKPCGIGGGLRTKINANIGTSTDRIDAGEELKKLKTALDYGADTIMDLSVGGDLRRIRKAILRNSDVPVGTVPIYEIAVNAQKNKGDFRKFSAGDILAVLEAQAADGVDFFTIHSGITQKSLAAIKERRRVLGVVSRGGAILASWMAYHRKENPLYEYFDRILDIASKFDVTLSLGDALRPGSILDATDKAQLAELKILGELALRSRRRNVQVIIEGPGHVPLNQIKKNVELEKRLCHQAPFYVLGPLPTDVTAGYDHITAAIGAALAASYGADFLCYVTASEHLRHPSIEDVKEGVIASRIAAHIGDIVKNNKSAIKWDRAMSEARKRRDWKKQILLSMDPHKARHYRGSLRTLASDVCSMCGRYCSIKLMQEYMKF